MNSNLSFHIVWESVNSKKCKEKINLNLLQSQLKYLQGLWAKMNWNIKAFLRRRSTFWKENMWRCANVHKILPSSYFFFRQKNGSYFSPANIRHRRYVLPLFSTLLKLKILWSWIYSDFEISFLREIIYLPHSFIQKESCWLQIFSWNHLQKKI